MLSVFLHSRSTPLEGSSWAPMQPISTRKMRRSLCFRHQDQTNPRWKRARKIHGRRRRYHRRHPLLFLSLATKTHAPSQYNPFWKLGFLFTRSGGLPKTAAVVGENLEFSERKNVAAIQKQNEVSEEFCPKPDSKCHKCKCCGWLFAPHCRSPRALSLLGPSFCNGSNCFVSNTNKKMKDSRMERRKETKKMTQWWSVIWFPCGRSCSMPENVYTCIANLIQHYIAMWSAMWSK